MGPQYMPKYQRRFLAWLSGNQIEEGCTAPILDDRPLAKAVYPRQRGGDLTAGQIRWCEKNIPKFAECRKAAERAISQAEKERQRLTDSAN